MGKIGIKKHISTFTALIVITLLLAAGLLVGALAPATADAHQAQEEKLLQFSSGGHVLGFGLNEVYLAGLDHSLKVEFVGGNGNAISPFAESSGMAESGIPELGKVIYSAIWENIDVTFSATSGGIAESTYIINPGGDPDDISLRYNVPFEIMEEGGLRLNFETGYMTESAPIAWQQIEGRQSAVAVQFERQAENQVGFSLGSHNPAHPVYIDPVYQWHTFFGGTGSDNGKAIAVDSSGNVYVTGESASSWNGPGGATPLNSHIDDRSSAGGQAIVIVKLNSAGAYQWHTFYGGERTNIGYSIAVDSWNFVYVTGGSYETWNGPSGELPLNAHDGPNLGGGDMDLVVVKLNSAGAYQWHTFYGGADHDRGEGIAVDSSGNVYVAGRSDASWSGPGGVFGDPLNFHAGGNYMSDIVVIKLNSEGTYQWHTFYGSTSIDEATSIAVDSLDNVYVTGFSNQSWKGPSSALGPESVEPLNPHAGGRDIVVIKLNSAGAYQWHTFHGGADNDTGYAIAVDPSGNVYVTGNSRSWSGPVGEEPRNPHSGDGDLVVVKLNSGGTYQWHTFYGSARDDIGAGIFVDTSGNVFVTGSSHSWNGPGGEAPRIPHIGDGFRALVVVKLNSTGAYQGHTYYGETGGSGNDIVVDSSGSAYVAGKVASTWGSPLNAYAGSSDIVIIKNFTDSNATQQPGLDASQWLSSFYVAYWGRAGDPGGLDYWLGEVSRGATDVPGVAENFALSAEAKAMYPYFNAPKTATDGERTTFVQAVYQNLLNRPVPADDEGVVYWVGELRNGNTTPGAVIGNMIHAAIQANSTDWLTIWNKVQAAEYFTQRFEAQNRVWQGSDLSLARQALEGVTDDPATVDAGKAKVDGILP